MVTWSVPKKIRTAPVLSTPFRQVPAGGGGLREMERAMPRALRGRLSEWMHIEQRQPQRMPRLPPRGLALSSQPEDIIQMLSGLVDVKERPNWVSNPGRFSSPPVKRHLARTWLPVPFLQPWLPPCRPNLCLCLSLSSWRDA